MPSEGREQRPCKRVFHHSGCCQKGPGPDLTGPEQTPCSQCWDPGWVLDGKKNGTEAVCLELMPCIFPPCSASGRPVATFAVYQTFARVVTHPTSGRVMALTEGDGNTWNRTPATAREQTDA